MPHAYQVGPETWVEIEVRIFDAEGDSLVDGEERVGFVFGRGRMFAGIERALEGRTAGDTRSVELTPREAYGDRDDALIVAVAREEFPDTVRPGDRFEADNTEGEVLVLRVVDVSDEEVRVDFNHPLAGQTVRFDIEILEVRPATASELAQAEPGEGLLRPESLLKGASRRYENALTEGVMIEEPAMGSVIEEKKA